MTKKLAAEFIGTFWLVLGGCGSAVLAANFGGDGNPLGIGLLLLSLAFGLTVPAPSPPTASARTRRVATAWRPRSCAKS